jgi:hypothetical protein
MSRIDTIIPDQNTSRRSAVASHHNHPEPDQFALGAGEAIPAPAPGLLSDEEVAALAKEAETLRGTLKLTHEQFIARFKTYLMGTKGWHLVRNKVQSQWDAGYGRLKENMRGFRSAVRDALADDPNPLLEVPHVETFAKALVQLRRKRSSQRVSFLLGPTGSGKTSTLQLARHKLADGRRVLWINGRQAWQSPREFLIDMALMLGIDDMPHSVAAGQRRVQEALIALGDAFIFMDEGHRLTAAIINMLIDWLNALAAAPDNSVHFVIAAIDTLWSKLGTEARAEADQLRINRGIGEQTLLPPDAAEIDRLLCAPEAGCRAKAQLSDGHYNELLAKLAGYAATSGSRAYVRDVRALLAKQARVTLKDAENGALRIAETVAAKNRTRR